jgi:hypothetical protein
MTPPPLLYRNADNQPAGGSMSTFNMQCGWRKVALSDEAIKEFRLAMRGEVLTRIRDYDEVRMIWNGCITISARPDRTLHRRGGCHYRRILPARTI